MGLEIELIVGTTFKDSAGVRKFMVELGQKRIGDGHKTSR
jgi:hypothetical protein